MSRGSSPSDAFRAMQPVIAAAKIKMLLQRQQHQSVLQLSDQFIGDSGCLALANFIVNRTDLHTLELKGNDIGGAGITALSESLNTTGIRHLSLEWNNLGGSDAGLLTFFETLATSRTIESLDLRNNQISGEFGACIAQFLKHNHSLQVLDLRWNQLGNLGAKPLISSGLPNNHSLIALELAGNHISEQNLIKIDLFINRNRAQHGLPEIVRRRDDPVLTERLLEHSPGAQTKENRLNKEILKVHLHKQEGRKAEKATVDTLMQQTELKRIEAQKKEQELQEKEAELESERERIDSLRQTLSQELEEERKEKVRLVSEANELKSNLAKNNNDSIRIIQELNLKVERAVQQRRHEQTRLKALKETREKAGQNYKDRIAALEKVIQEQVIRNNENALQLDSDQNKLEKETSMEMRVIRDKYELQFKKLTEQLHQVQQGRSEAETQNKLLQKQFLEMNISFQSEAQSVETEASEHSQRAFQGSLIQIEGQLKGLENSRKNALARLAEDAKEKEARKQNFNQNLGRKQKEVELIRQELNQVRKEGEQVGIQNAELSSELMRIEGLIEKQESGLKQASSEAQSLKLTGRSQIESITNEGKNARKASDAQMIVLASRVRNLEKEVARVEQELRERKMREQQVADELIHELDSTIRSHLPSKLRII